MPGRISVIDDRICIPVPLFHCFGCVLGVLACVNHGATMVFVETYDPVDVMMSIEMEKCTGVYGVPTMFIAMMDHKLFNKFDFSSLRTGIMAGSPCPVKSMNDCIDKMNMTRGDHRLRLDRGFAGNDPDPVQ